MEARNNFTPVTPDSRAQERKRKTAKMDYARGSESPLMEAKNNFTPVTPDSRAKKRKRKTDKMEV